MVARFHFIMIWNKVSLTKKAKCFQNTDLCIRIKEYEGIWILEKIMISVPYYHNLTPFQNCF